MLWQPGHPKLHNPGLPRAKYFPGTSKLKVPLRNIEAVGTFAQCLQALFAIAAQWRLIEQQAVTCDVAAPHPAPELV